MFYLDAVQLLPLFKGLQDCFDDIVSFDFRYFIVQHKVRTKSGLDIQDSI